MIEEIIFGSLCVEFFRVSLFTLVIPTFFCRQSAAPRIRTDLRAEDDPFSLMNDRLSMPEIAIKTHLLCDDISEFSLLDAPHNALTTALGNVTLVSGP
jgi:hypothetical protein